MPELRAAKRPRTPARAFDPVLFHPDYDRRLRNYTGSADLPTSGSARGLGISAFTAGGELHPALRTMQVNLHCDI